MNTTHSCIRHSHTALLLLIVLLTTTLGGCAVSPHPFTKQERAAQLLQDKTAMYAGQAAVSGPITLDDAIARALVYNLDNRVKLMEEAVSQHLLNSANFSMLPKLTANAGYTTRDNDYGSTSYNLLTGDPILIPSTSQDRHHTTSDLTFTWNILDFGVSYYQAKQQADQTLILQERRRKVVQTLVQQVRQAYWQAAAAQLLDSNIAQVILRAETALGNSRTAEQERLRSPMDSLNYQRQMLDILRQLEAVRDELNQAKPRLASIMNLPPTDDFTVVIPDRLEVPEITADLAKMEELALLQRPELMEASYNERISVLETRKAISRLFPGIEFSAGGNYDTNSYLLNNHWGSAGLRVGWNLMNVFNVSNTRKLAAAQLEVSRDQRLALSMAVLTQVHVAYRDYLGRKHQYDRNNDLFGVDQRILTHTHNAASASADSQLQEMRANASALMSELRYYQSYGALQSAYGQILATLGADLLPASLPSHDLASLSQAVKQAGLQADSQFGTINKPAVPPLLAPLPVIKTATETAPAETKSKRRNKNK